jgi:hypothetical protein
MNRDELLAKFERIAREAFESRWICGLLVGPASRDDRFERDRRDAERLLRRRCWSLADVEALVEKLDQGILAIPARKAAGRGAQRSGGLASMLQGTGGSEWDRDVQAWALIPQTLPPEPPATPQQVEWWREEAAYRMRGHAPRPRPWAPKHPYGYGQTSAASAARRSPAPGSLMHGARADALFSRVPTLEQAGAKAVGD